MSKQAEAPQLSAFSLGGLTREEVERARRSYGENSFTRGVRRSFFTQYLESFGDPIIKILLAALVLNLLFMFRNHNWFETVGIAAAVFLATLVSTLSEYGSESAFLRLQEEAARLTCRVKRREGLCMLPVGEVVVGDVVLLQQGEKIPADGILVTGELSVDQSAINGESAEVTKCPQAATARQWSPAQKNQLFRGTVVAAGEGAMVVRNVGDGTLYGSLAVELQGETVQSPMKVRLAALARSISRLGYTAAALIAFADLYNALVIDNAYNLAAILVELRSLPDMLEHLMHAALLAISIVVVAVPEGLPMMITVVLSSNMLRMQRDSVMVRKLVGIETAGSINILLSDKTGTLTTGRLAVEAMVTGDGTEHTSLDSLRRSGELLRLLGLSCVYNTQAALAAGHAVGGNSTERALLECCVPLAAGLGSCRRLGGERFNSTNKYSWEKLETPAGVVVLVKGAPEKLLERCTGYYDHNGVRHAGLPEELRRRLGEMTKSAMRVLLLATAERDLDSTAPLTLVALAGIRDSLRPQVKKAVRTVREAGIQTVMITGDNKETAMAVAREAGLLTGARGELALTGEELARLGDSQLCTMLPQLRVVARALPSDKSRLVRLSQQLGLVVGMTGDGINDAPALKRADVGFAMGDGTEVAKEAGDIVILDNNFASITKAILYGRTIFRSIRKFIVFQLTMNFCAVGVSLIGPFIGIDTPVTIIQMLWINIIMDTLAGLAFAGETPQKEYMRELPKSRAEPIISRAMLGQILVTGSYTILLCTAFLCMPALRTAFGYSTSYIAYMTAFFTLFIFCGIFNAFSARTTRLNIFAHLGRNPGFVAIMAAVSAVQLLLVFFGGELFRTVPLSLPQLRGVLLLAASVIPFDLLRKVLLRLQVFR